MLNKFIISIVAIFGSLLLTSCSNSEELKLVESPNFWGKVNYFDDFLWSKYEPEIFTKTICIDLNKEACKQIKSLSFGVFELDSDGQYVRTDTDVAQFYVNGDECDGNEFKIDVAEHTEIDLGIKLSDDAQEGTTTYFLKILDNNILLDRVNDLVVESGDVIPATFELKIFKNDSANTLKVGFTTLLMILLAALTAWIVAIRQIFYPRFKIIKIIFDGQDFNNSVYFGTRAKGAYKIIFSNKKQSQNILSKIFKGRVEYVCNPFFSDGEMQAIPAPQRSVRFKPGRSGYVISPSNKLNSNDIDSTIENSDSKVTISIL